MTATQTTLVYFSPTNTTKAVLTAIADGIGLPTQHIDLTLPAARKKSYAFGKDELVIIGFPHHRLCCTLYKAAGFEQIVFRDGGANNTSRPGIELVSWRRAASTGTTQYRH